MADTSSTRPEGNNLALIKDPTLAKNRIFLGNIPVCTKEELESIGGPYGTVIASMVKDKFAFLQFETEEVANKAAKALHKSTFKGKPINVRNAGYQKPAPAPKPTGAGIQPPPMIDNSNPDINDCEIIVVNKNNTEYAEYVEDQLKRLNLRVDLLFPNEEVPIGKVLANISSRGCLYAVLVTSDHQVNRTLNVSVLYGEPTEHKNMNVEDGINLIYEDFKSHKASHMQQIQQQQQQQQQPTQRLPQPQAVKRNYLSTKHPESMQVLLNLLANNMSLTVLQFDALLKYLREKRQEQVTAELGSNINAPDPEIEMQKKLMNILTKPSVAETHYDILYPDVDSLKDDFRLLELLKDVRVQRALDSIMKSPLVETIEKHMKF